MRDTEAHAHIAKPGRLFTDSLPVVTPGGRLSSVLRGLAQIANEANFAARNRRVRAISFTAGPTDVARRHCSLLSLFASVLAYALVYVITDNNGLN